MIFHSNPRIITKVKCSLLPTYIQCQFWRKICQLLMVYSMWCICFSEQLYFHLHLLIIHSLIFDWKLLVENVSKTRPRKRLKVNSLDRKQPGPLDCYNIMLLHVIGKLKEKLNIVARGRPESSLFSQ
jgi:hypothetical protein